MGDYFDLFFTNAVKVFTHGQYVRSAVHRARKEGSRERFLNRHLSKRGRVYETATDQEAIQACMQLSRIEGIIPALESSHALAYAIKLAKTLDKEKIIIVNLSGRGDKDVHIIQQAVTFE